MDKWRAFVNKAMHFFHKMWEILDSLRNCQLRNQESVVCNAVSSIGIVY